jgi:HSP20 family molecular chaperone IbpA
MAFCSVADYHDPLSPAFWQSNTSHQPAYIITDMNRSLTDIDRDMRQLQRMIPHRPVPGGEIESLHRKQKCFSTMIEEDGIKKYQWIFDVNNYKPENVTIKTLDGKVEVQATFQEESEHHRVYRQVSRFIKLPKGAKLEELSSTMSDKGWLKITAPYEAPVTGEKDGFTPIPIQHQ